MGSAARTYSPGMMLITRERMRPAIITTETQRHRGDVVTYSAGKTTALCLWASVVIVICGALAPRELLSSNRLVNRHELGAVRERALDLNLRDHRRHAVHHGVG